MKEAVADQKEQITSLNKQLKESKAETALQKEQITSLDDQLNLSDNDSVEK